MRYKKKANPLKALIIIFVVLIIIVGLGVGLMYGADKFLHSSYPQDYKEYVAKYSAEYDLDSLMVYSFIRTESGFDPESESYLGARGLMQLMPETFEWIRYRLDEEENPDMDFDAMYSPETNIRYGCYLLSYLKEQFGDDISVIAAAYHAGAGNVSEWIENPEYYSEGRLINIPISDTAHYVDKIQGAYNMYCKLYG